MIDIKEVLFWIFLVLGLTLLVWNVFGNSPSEFIAQVTILLTVVMKLWTVSDRQIRLEMRFGALAQDFKEHLRKHT